MKHLIKFAPVANVAMSVQHKGNDQQYCEAGETVRLNWQPSSGWGLAGAHYTDEDGNVVDIDLSTREFTMPAKAITIGGTAKRFQASDWKDAVTFDEHGNVQVKGVLLVDKGVIVGSSDDPRGISIYDDITGEQYIIHVEEGVLKCELIA